MAEPTRIGDLQINQDLPHQRLEWKIERAGWAVMAVTLLASLGGLLGPGPLSHATAGSEPLQVEYNRLARYQAPESLRVQIAREARSREGKIRLWLGREFVENIELRHIDPEPERVVAGPDRFLYSFHVSEGQHAVTVIFHFEPNNFGRLATGVGLDNGPEVEVKQFIYP